MLNPVRVREYAEATGWTRVGAVDGVAAVLSTARNGFGEMVLPLAKDLRDFGRRMAEAVCYIAEVEQRDVLQVLNDLLLPPTDVLRFGIAGAAARDGFIRLDDGLALLGGARKSVMAAACSALKPQHFHPRLSRTETEQLLRSCQLGQTERGSYIVTIACPVIRLNDVDAEEEASVPFGRQTTELLVRTVERLTASIDSGALDDLWKDGAEREPGLSANLCDALVEMQPESDELMVSLSASWSKTLPPPKSVAGNKPVFLKPEYIPRIAELSSRLRPASEAKRQSLVGWVETLDGKPGASGRTEGSVYLRVINFEGDALLARADVGPDDYLIAAQAHMQPCPVALSGVLLRRPKISRIQDVQGLHLTEGRTV
jgi:hypothetical protein